MNRNATERMAKGWSLIAEGAMELSLAYEAIEPPLARSGVPASLPADSLEAGTPLPVSGPSQWVKNAELPPVPSFDELPPEGFDAPLVYDERITAGDPVPVLKPQVEAGLGKCPVHGKPWSVKAAGVSKAGAPYESFYKCDSKDGDEFCKQKPQKIWRDLHPIPGTSVAA